MDNRLSQIETLWSMVRRAHDDAGDATRSAQEQMIDRYGPAIRRYLIASLRDPETADEVYQEFCFRFVSGKFQSADPSRGRFRSFVKTCIIHLMYEHRRRGKRRREEHVGDNEFPGDREATQQQDEEFTQVWREQVLERCWDALRDMDKKRNRDYYEVLRFRVDHPALRSNELAEALTQQLGRPVTAGGVRVTLHRAREAFAQILISDIRESLADSSFDNLEAELIELDLHKYCREELAAIQSTDNPQD